jgi:threonine/homoserine/homoserine lactone efflux protein
VPDPATLLVFAGASAALVAVPGPAVLYIVSRSIAHGRRAGVVSMAGIESGNVVQVLAATAGLSAIVASSAIAFETVRYVGAAYLIYLGLRTLLSGAPPADPDAPRTRSSRRLYWQGVLVGTLNPKLALFLLAFLPQFIDPAAGPVWSQTLTLGLLFSVIATIGDGLIAIVAGTAAESVRAGLGARILPRVGGGVLVGLGVYTALAGDPPRRG